MKYKRFWKRFFSFFLVFVVTVMCVVGSYGQAYASNPDVVVSTDSNAAYSQSLYLYPELRVGAGVAEGAYWVIAAILTLCGLHLSGDELVKFVDDFVTWGNVKYGADKAIKAELDRLSQGVAGTYFSLIPIIKIYIKSKYATYNMQAEDYNRFVSSATLTDDIRHSTVARWTRTDSTYLFSFEDSKGNYYDGGVGLTRLEWGYCFYLSDTGQLAVLRLDSTGKTVKGNLCKYFYESAIWLSITDVFVDIDFCKAVADYTGIPVFQLRSDAEKYLLAGADPAVTGFQTAKTGIVWPDLAKDILDNLTVVGTPTAEEWAAIQEQLANAVTVDEVRDIVSSVVVGTGTGSGTGEGDDTDPVLPIVPDLTGIIDFLKAILSAITGLPGQIAGTLVSKLVGALVTSVIGLDIGDIRDLLDGIADWDIGALTGILSGAMPDIVTGVQAIPGILSGIKEEILAIPGILSGLKEQVQAIPQSIATAITDGLALDQEGADGQYQVSSIISDKFPFCIPFDLVACVKVLQQNAKPPYWEIPFKLNYRDMVLADEVIVIDLHTGNWQGLVYVVRGFVLLSYVSALIILTRRLIKG